MNKDRQRSAGNESSRDKKRVVGRGRYRRRPVRTDRDQQNRKIPAYLQSRCTTVIKL